MDAPIFLKPKASDSVFVQEVHSGCSFSPLNIVVPISRVLYDTQHGIMILIGLIVQGSISDSEMMRRCKYMVSQVHSEEIISNFSSN